MLVKTSVEIELIFILYVSAKKETTLQFSVGYY